MGAALYDDSPAFVKVWLGGVYPFSSGSNRLNEVVIRIVGTPGTLTVAKPTFHSSYCQIGSMTEEVTLNGADEWHDWTVRITGFNRTVPASRAAMPFMNWSMLLARGIKEWEPRVETKRVMGLSKVLPYMDVPIGKICRVCPGVITMHYTIMPFVAAEPSPT